MVLLIRSVSTGDPEHSMAKNLPQISHSAWPTEPGCDLGPKQDSSPLALLFRVIGIWMERGRRRRRLRELAELNNYLLLDIGITQEEAMREAAKPFWKR